jgi:hypothetical protein
MILAAAALALPIHSGIVHFGPATPIAGDHKKKDKEKDGEEEKKEGTLLAGDHKKDKGKDGEEEKKEGTLVA